MFVAMNIIALARALTGRSIKISPPNQVAASASKVTRKRLPMFRASMESASR